MCGEKRQMKRNRLNRRGSPPRVRGKDMSETNGILGGRITPACAGKSQIILLLLFLCRDHPRVCGEKLFAEWTYFTCVGSPPRVRGKATCRMVALCLRRITPACAGKRYKKGIALTGDEDHPRVCGEKCFRKLTASSPVGSPPRVRGKVRGMRTKQGMSRITPACAGKRPPAAPKPMQSEDHPRVCGEKISSLLSAA